MRLPKVTKSERIQGENYKGVVLYHEDGSHCAVVTFDLASTKKEEDKKDATD